MLPDPTELRDVRCPKTSADSEAFPVLSSALVAFGKQILCARTQDETKISVTLTRGKNKNIRNKSAL